MESTGDWKQISAWRKEQRPLLIARREGLSDTQRKGWNLAITQHLESGFPALGRMAVGFCWPYRAEFDPRFAIRAWRRAGAAAALPAVVDKKGPLEFRQWWPGAPMTRGVYDIPVPDGTTRVVPDAAIVPMNGFDEQGYRLGYGGGYFDRTLAAITPRPLAIGVAYELGRLETIFPQSHDLPMDFVITEMGIHVAGKERLERIDPEACVVRVRRLCAERGLPRAQAPRSYSSPVCYAADFPGYFGEASPNRGEE